jgi:hypothetical protein
MWFLKELESHANITFSEESLSLHMYYLPPMKIFVWGTGIGRAGLY